MGERETQTEKKAALSIVFLILFCAALWIIIFIFSGSYELASAITSLFFVSICKFVKQIHDLFLQLADIFKGLESQFQAGEDKKSISAKIIAGIYAGFSKSKGLWWAGAGILLAIAGLGFPSALIPLVFPALAMYCGYEAKRSGKRCLGWGVVGLSMVAMIIRMGIMSYGVLPEIESGALPFQIEDMPDMKKAYLLLFSLAYLIVLVLTIPGLIFFFLWLMKDIFRMKEAAKVRTRLFVVILLGLVLHVISSDIVREWVVKFVGG